MFRAAALIAAVMLAACEPEFVTWELEERASAMLLPGSRLAIDGRGRAGVVPAWTAPTVPAGDVCPESLVATQARGDTAFAVWWVPRAAGRVLLVAARSDDGGLNWREPEVADSTDRGSTGCVRPPPFVTFDTLSGYLHVTYFLVAKEGPGVFFTHSMTGGTMFHAAVPIVYGERASASAVAAHGDTVAVAFEDPNAAEPQLWLALSTSGGHIFDGRTSVSSTSARASHPAVAVRAGRVAVGWNETPRAGGPVAATIRVGRLR